MITEIFMMVIGKMESNMVMDKCFSKIILYTEDNGKMIKYVAKENIFL